MQITPKYTSTKHFVEGIYPQLRVGTETDNAEISASGVTRLNGAATVWEDLRFSFSQTKVGSNLKPDFDETNVGLLFPQNNTSEITHIIGQMPHSWKEGSSIYPHIHWQQMNTNAVVWKLAYKIFNIGEAVPAVFTVLTSTSNATAYTSGSLSQLTSFPPIDCTGKKISAMLLMKVYREDNVDGGMPTGDALAFELDVHHEIDSGGSDTLFAK